MSNTKFYIKPLKKSFTLKFTNRNVLEAVRYELLTNPEIDENEEVTADSLREASKQKLKIYNSHREFIQKVFNLSDKDANKLLDADDTELENLCTILSMKLQKYPESVIKQVKEVQRDPKKSEALERQAHDVDGGEKVQAGQSTGGHQTNTKA